MNTVCPSCGAVQEQRVVCPVKCGDFKVAVYSDLYGADEFGPYDTLQEAYEAIGRLASKATEFPDTLREYRVVPS